MREDEKQEESLYVRMNNNGGDVNCKCMSVFAQSWGEWKNPCVNDGSRFFPAIMKSTMVECACG